MLGGVEATLGKDGADGEWDVFGGEAGGRELAGLGGGEGGEVGFKFDESDSAGVFAGVVVEPFGDGFDGVGTAVGGDDAVAFEEGVEFGGDVGVVAGVEEAHEGVEPDDGGRLGCWVGAFEGGDLVDDSSGVGGEDGDMVTIAAGGEEHLDAGWEGRAGEAFVDVAGGEEGGGRGSGRGGGAFEEAEVGDGGGVEGGGEEGDGPVEGLLGVESMGAGVGVGLEAGEGLCERGELHGEMVAGSGGEGVAVDAPVDLPQFVGAHPFGHDAAAVMDAGLEVVGDERPGGVGVADDGVESAGAWVVEDASHARLLVPQVSTMHR